MKTTNPYFSFYSLCIGGILFFINSCNYDKNIETEPVKPNTQIEKAYYITGLLNDEQERPVSSATVMLNNGNQQQTSADGSFSIKVNETGDYSVVISKNGYITRHLSVNLNENSSYQSSAYLFAKMYPLAQPVSVDIQGGTVADSNNNKLIIPENALSKTTDISLTYLEKIDQQIAPTNGEKVIPGKILNFQPDGLTFNKPVILEIPSTNAIQSNVSLYLYDPVALVWNKETDLQLSEDGTRLTGEIRHFSTYALAENCNIVLGNEMVSDLVDYSKTVSNCGNLSSMPWEQNVKRRIGYIYKTPVSEIVASITGLTPEQQEIVSEKIIKSVEVMNPMPENQKNGFYLIDIKKDPVNIPADYTLTYLGKTKTRDITYNFSFHISGSTIHVPVTITQATGSDIKITLSDCRQHSGGGGY